MFPNSAETLARWSFKFARLEPDRLTPDHKSDWAAISIRVSEIQTTDSWPWYCFILQEGNSSPLASGWVYNWISRVELLISWYLLLYSPLNVTEDYLLTHCNSLLCLCQRDISPGWVWESHSAAQKMLHATVQAFSTTVNTNLSLILGSTEVLTFLSFSQGQVIYLPHLLRLTKTRLNTWLLLRTTWSVWNSSFSKNMVHLITTQGPYVSQQLPCFVSSKTNWRTSVGECAPQ